MLGAWAAHGTEALDLGPHGSERTATGTCCGAKYAPSYLICQFGDGGARGAPFPYFFPLLSTGRKAVRKWCPLCPPPR